MSRSQLSHGQQRPFIVGLGGTLRAGSTSERALALALRYAEQRGAATQLICGHDLTLPFYDPQQAIDWDGARDLRDCLRQADGVILPSPCYHGSISGLLKNALDYVEDLREDRRPYLDGRAVGCIGCGAGAQGPSMVLTELRTIVHSLRGWCTPLGVVINTLQVSIADGTCSDPAVDKQIAIMAGQVVDFAMMTMGQGRSTADAMAV
jgi:FMN reductase